jgi:hypothetical protein
MFSFWKNPVEKCTRSFPRCNVNRGKVTSLRLLVSPPAAPSIINIIIRFLIPCSAVVFLPAVYRYKSYWCWGWCSFYDDQCPQLFRVCEVTREWAFKKPWFLPDATNWLWLYVYYILILSRNDVCPSEEDRWAFEGKILGFDLHVEGGWCGQTSHISGSIGCISTRGLPSGPFPDSYIMYDG